jgi:GNAT superfamily N-acetyltransferase
MKEGYKEDGLTLREANGDDIPQLCTHHRKMFEEIWETRGQSIESSIAIEIERAYSLKLSAELPSGSCKSWLMESGNQLLASGAISIVSFVPSPVDLSSRVAYLHSVYTEPGLRGRNLASRIVECALSYCKTNGIKRVILDASEAGRPIYERIGFSASTNSMRILVE